MKTWETGTIVNGDLTYNIQIRQLQDSSWQQRHIWYRDQLGEHDPPCVQKWIPTYRHDEHNLKRMTLVSRQIAETTRHKERKA